MVIDGPSVDSNKEPFVVFDKPFAESDEPFVDNGVELTLWGPA